MSFSIVILAAGQGKRMGSSLPKVLHRLGGRPLISHVIESVRALKPDRICVVYGHGGEQVPNALTGARVVMIRQRPQLGTGHALRQALPHLGKSETTLVLYGDVPLIRRDTLRQMVNRRAHDVTVLTAELEDPRGYGRIVRDRKGRVVKIVEERDASEAQRKIREVNTGIMALPTSRLAAWLAKIENRNSQREYYLTDVVGIALSEGAAVNVVPVREPSEALGVNSRAQLAQLERIYQLQYANRLLEHGVALADPMRLDIRGDLQCGRDVAIDVNCVFEGKVKLGNHVGIGANCVLKNAVIGAGTRVEPFTYIDDAVVGAECRIGPYARIRPGTRLAEQVHIGNFVEVKASEIAARSKANHLAYVGDSTVGRDVNIGAGTITCNYDGAEKHRTVIEDDAFIGSDVQLVAPVTVGKGATIGAGATITRNAPPGALTLSRREQITRPGWKRPRKKAGRER